MNYIFYEKLYIDHKNNDEVRYLLEALEGISTCLHDVVYEHFNQLNIHFHKIRVSEAIKVDLWNQFFKDQEVVVENNQRAKKEFESIKEGLGISAIEHAADIVSLEKGVSIMAYFKSSGTILSIGAELFKAVIKYQKILDLEEEANLYRIILKQMKEELKKQDNIIKTSREKLQSMGLLNY